MVRRAFGAVVTMLMMVVVSSACGSDAIVADPTVAAFVGTWDADSLTMTSDADTTVVANVLDFGSFVIIIEPSGQYTATLTVFGQSSPEIGQLTVQSGSTLTLAPTFPPGRPAASANYSFQGDGDLTLEGPSEFDFNFDDIDEPAQAYTHLVRR